MKPQPFVPPSAIDATGTRPWSPQSLEARLLAGSLRSVPLTLLHGSDAADREGLLTCGVMPLLGRRREDRAAPVRPARVLPFPDRRRALGRGAVPAEVVLLIDDWPGPPLQPLAARIERAQALSAADDPAAAGATSGRLLLVMQHFEAALDSAASALHPDRFWFELARALRTRPHRLHALLVTQEANTPAVRWLLRHLPELGEQALLLQPGADPHLAPVPGLRDDADSPATVPLISDQEWSDAVQGAVERAAGRAGVRKVPATAPTVAPPDDAARQPAALTVASRAASTVTEPAARTAPALGAAAARLLAPAAAPMPTRPVAPAAVSRPKPTAPAAVANGRRGMPSRLLLPVLGAAACAALVMGSWRFVNSEPARIARSSNPPVSVTGAGVAPPAPALHVAAESASALPVPGGALPAPPAPVPHVPAEPGSVLRGLLAGLPLLDLRGAPAPSAARLSAARQPTLALVRYDTLQRFPSSQGLASLRVVAPLFVEPVQVWVRADSPQRRLDALAQGVIDVGRDDGDAATAAGVTEALFGKPLPASRQRRLADDQALVALRRGEVDAVLRVQASPLTATATASVAQGGLQTLTLDRATPAGARALRDYLPAPTAAAAGLDTAASDTLGVMSLLVVQGGDDTARQRLASDALRAVCAGLPALRSAAGGAAVRPEVQLPAGRPYALSAERSAACGADSAEPIHATSDPPTPKGNLQ